MCDTITISNKHVSNEQKIIIERIQSKLQHNSDNPRFVIYSVSPNRSTRKFFVIQDGHLIAGTKQRVGKLIVKYAMKQNDKIDTLLYTGTANGFGAVATAYTAYKLGLKSQIFLSGAESDINSRQINTLLALNAHITMCPTFKLAREAQYKISDFPISKKKNVNNPTPNISTDTHWETRPNMFNLPMGLNDSGGIMSTLLSRQITKAAKSTMLENVSKEMRIWLVAGSGGIAQAIFKAFPRAKLFLYLTGSGKYKQEVIDWAKSESARVHIIDPKSELERNNDCYLYYSSVKNYDDLIWPYVKKYGKDGDFIWNVASDDYLYF